MTLRQTFELLVGRWLFNPEAGDDWTMEDDHLAKMMELTGQRFPPSMLARAAHRQKYFDDEGTFTHLGTGAEKCNSMKH